MFMGNHESAFLTKGMFFEGVLQSSVRISHRSSRRENRSFCCCATPKIITSMPLYETYWIKMESYLVEESTNYSGMNYFGGENSESVFWKKRMFFGVPVPRVWQRLCENHGCEDFVLASCSFKAYYKLHRLTFTWLDAMMDIKVSG